MRLFVRTCLENVSHCLVMLIEVLQLGGKFHMFCSSSNFKCWFVGQVKLCCFGVHKCQLCWSLTNSVLSYLDHTLLD